MSLMTDKPTTTVRHGPQVESKSHKTGADPSRAGMKTMRVNVLMVIFSALLGSSTAFAPPMVLPVRSVTRSRGRRAFIMHSPLSSRNLRGAMHSPLSNRNLRGATKSVQSPKMAESTAETKTVVDMAADMVADIEAAAMRLRSTKVTSPIIFQFSTSARWLWHRWKGTVFEVIWPYLVQKVLLSTITCIAIRYWAGGAWPLFADPTVTASGYAWALFAAPNESVIFFRRLTCFNIMWNFLLSLTTFVLTFFLSLSYQYWVAQLETCRAIQGRIHDVNLLLAGNCKRDVDTGKYTAASQSLLNATARNFQALHAFFWMSQDKSLSIMHQAPGLDKMVSDGFLTNNEKEILLSSGAAGYPTGDRANVVLNWIMSRVARCESNLMEGLPLTNYISTQLCQLRRNMNLLKNKRVDRIPLAYIHVVQLLVDLDHVACSHSTLPESG